MGCIDGQENCRENSKPAHSVTLSSFYMGETEVTWALWKALGGTSWRDEEDGDDLSHWWDGYEPQEDYLNCPIDVITYFEAEEICEKLNQLLSQELPSGYKFALPSEAQWEYAARGGKHHSVYTYSGSNIVDEVAWTSRQVHPVKMKKPNALGLYDMSGNVAEWCKDGFNDYSPSTVKDPILLTTKKYCDGTCRVLRSGRSNPQVWYRMAGNPDHRFITTQGFRLALIRQGTSNYISN